MNLLRTALPFFLASLGAVELTAQSPAPLLGTWRCCEPADSHEVLEFERGGTLRVDRTTVKYEIEGSALRLVGERGTITGTWSLADDELTVVLELGAQGSKTARYRRTANVLTIGPVCCEVPAGWSLSRETAEGAVVNPGLLPKDTLDALILVLHGPLREAERGQDLVDVVRARLPELARELRAQGVTADWKSVEPARTLELAGVANGTRQVRIWLAANGDRERFAVVVAVLVAARADAYRPALERMRDSLKFVEIPAASANLAGAEFGRTSFGSGGNSMTTTYTFTRTGTVTRRTMFSSSIGGSDRSERGTWTANGERVTLAFKTGTLEALVRANALRIGGAEYPRLSGR